MINFGLADGEKATFSVPLDVSPGLQTYITEMSPGAIMQFMITDTGYGVNYFSHTARYIFGQIFASLNSIHCCSLKEQLLLQLELMSITMETT